MTTGIAKLRVLGPVEEDDEGNPLPRAETGFQTRVTFGEGQTWQEAAAATIEATMPWLEIADYVEFEEQT